MKKLLTMFATLAIASSLAIPAFAKKGKKAKKSETSMSETAPKKKHGKMHFLHSKKKGATKGEKTGQ